MSEVIPADTGRESCWHHGKDRHQRDAFKVSSDAGAELGQTRPQVKGAEGFAEYGQAVGFQSMSCQTEPASWDPVDRRAGPEGGDGNILLCPR